MIGRAAAVPPVPTLDEIRDGWNAAAEQDAMGNILTRGLPWDTSEFFQTGRAEINAALEHLSGFLSYRRELALDFGCGIGRVTQALAEHYARVVGVDIAPSMVRQARAHNQHPDRVHYQERLPQGSFDLIYTILVLQHMPQPVAHHYISEFIGLLHPDGVAVFEIPDGPDYRHPKDHLSMYSSDQDTIRRVVDQAGGVVVDVEIVPCDSGAWVPYRYAAKRA
jgi:2-polyprenyl-3-methyl-5-hydroxy-6-metoxy-1,4-benzoquinol methylase